MSFVNLTEPIRIARNAGEGGWQARTIQVIGDVHVGWTPQQRLDDAQADLIQTDGLAALRVFIGDLTDTVADSTQDTAALALLNASSSSGWKAVIGNHDRQQSSSPTWETVYGQTRNWYQDIGRDVRVIGVSPDTGGANPITLTTATLNWLDARLAETARHCLICCHAPLLNTHFGGWFNTDTTFFTAQPDADIRAILKARPNARAWISGHTHTPLTSTSLFTPISLGDGQYITAINTGAVAYTAFEGGGGVPSPATDALDDPNFSIFVTCLPQTIEVRVRDHLTHQWTSWQSDVSAVLDRNPDTARGGMSLSLPKPLVFLSPDGSFDENGLITPTTAGTVTTTAGVYGTAWNFTAGKISVPALGHALPDRGTALVRAVVGPYAGDRRVLLDIGQTSANYTLFQLQYSGTSPYTTLQFAHYWNSVFDGNALLTSPYGASHVDLKTYMIRWDGANLDVVLGGRENEGVGTRVQTSGAFHSSHGLHVGADRNTTKFSQALVESVIVYDTWITDSEFDLIAGLDRAWSWEMLPGAPPLPVIAQPNAYSYPVPLLHAAPAASQDSVGSVTPTLVGTVTTVAGTYGNAWDIGTGDAVQVPLVAKNQRIRGDRGTVLIRAKAPTGGAGQRRVLCEIGDTTAAGFGMFSFYYHATTLNRLVLDVFTQSTQTGQAFVDSPYGETHTDLKTYMIRWDGEDLWIGIGASGNIRSGTRSTISPFQVGTKSIWFGATRGGGQRYLFGTIEDVLILDRAITDSEFDTAAAAPESWSWRLL